MKKITRLGFIVLWAAMWGWAWAGEDPRDFLKVSGPCGLDFPKDHGAHPGYRTEWWYYTGNLRTATGRPFGFQLTFFRYQLSPGVEDPAQTDPSSPWRTNQMYFAHAALTDISGKRFHYEEKARRGALGLGGVETTEEAVTVRVHPWSTFIGPDRHELQAEARNFALHLRLVPRKPLIRHGIDGYSVKGSAPERASCYYSFTRLEARGEVRVGGETHAVTGFAWMDHEFSSEPLEPGLQGWDWFSLQFADGTELMLFGLRQKDGAWHPASSGTFVDLSGEKRHLSRDDMSLDVLSWWKSPRSKAMYPAGWRLRVPSLHMEVEIWPNLADQELETGSSTGVTYWEGSVSCRSLRAGVSGEGFGYVELTGYARPFDTPL